jgi:hypothetical protein
MPKLPAIQFYPGDWLRDEVAGCSLGAQGLWLRMMFIAHDSERYGYLSLNGNAMPDDFVARRCGSSVTDYVTLLAELDRAGVPSRTPEGIIYSRRMVRDAKARTANALRQKKFRKVHSNGASNGSVTAVSHRSSSSSSSSSSLSPRGGGGKAEAKRQAMLAQLREEAVSRGGT